MTFEIQTAVVAIVVCGAVFYLARAGYQSMARKKAAACGGCDNCAAGEARTLVQIDAISQPSSEAKALVDG
jgi:hypothetical protein